MSNSRIKRKGKPIGADQFQHEVAAIHEAAHMIAALHWDVPIGKSGVSLTPGRGVVSGYSDVSWPLLPNNGLTWYRSLIGSVIAPFTEYRYSSLRPGRKFSNADFDQLLISSIGDFADIYGSEVVHVGRHTGGLSTGDMEKTQNIQKLMFLLWLRHPPDDWEQKIDGESAALLRDLVSDAEAILIAYWKQIMKLGNAILGADNLRLSADDVTTWRMEHFQKCDVSLSVRAK